MKASVVAIFFLFAVALRKCSAIKIVVQRSTCFLLKVNYDRNRFELANLPNHLPFLARAANCGKCMTVILFIQKALVNVVPPLCICQFPYIAYFQYGLTIAYRYRMNHSFAHLIHT